MVHNTLHVRIIMFPSWANITHNVIDRKLMVSHLVPHVQNMIKFMNHNKLLKGNCTLSVLLASKQYKLL